MVTSVVTLLCCAAATGQVAELPASPDMVLRWNELGLKAIRLEKTPPPLAARNLAIMHLAIYDAVNAVERTHEPYLGQPIAPSGTSAEAAAAAAGHRALAALYPQWKTLWDEALAQSLAAIPAGRGRDDGIGLGVAVADKMLDWRKHDGASGTSKYRFRNEVGCWRPTPPGFASPLLPGWVDVQAFAIKPGTQHKPVGPPRLESDAYTSAFVEVRALGGRASALRTGEQTQIAWFWSDDAGTSTPPGHWNRIAQTVARGKKNTLAENARLFALLNMSLADAGVLCWVLKFHHDFWRPVTAIVQAETDGNPRTGADADWFPLLPTPPFPAYTSGHSSFSGTAATILAEFHGTDRVAFASDSEGLPGVVRRFPGFWAAAEEAGQSRIYGGIHWQFDNQDGLAVGRTLGQYVARNFLRPRSGAGRRPDVILYPPQKQ